ncbi:hypothetical protein [Leucobacter komagatae]|uniref:Uncharacterized protein n=1 Tax=Leucobacter komagatae TaxID=55969 RepID=A0A0D0HW31_9MICO|nr:hypothetical protein [Leucobacter komagatae]KIP51846.1 hypothetical protein SD72_12995 [Leucobacter komagatae]
MRTALYEPTLPVSPVEVTGVTEWPPPDRAPQAEPARWRSQVFNAPTSDEPKRRRSTRYERFTTRMVLVSSVIMLTVTASLHVFNYGLETKTSSTSGTHGSFYKEED